MSKLLKGIFCLTVAVAFVAPAFADDSFEYHGYARMGAGTTTDFTSQGSGFQAPGSGAKYRLGNEPNNCYIENEFVKTWKGEGDEYAKFVFMGAWETTQTSNWEGNSSTSLKGDDVGDLDGDGNNDSVVTSDSDMSTGVVRQAYAEIGNMAWAPGVAFWAGSRYYMRKDIHINDFYYRDNSGWGGGVTGVGVGPAKLNLAYLTQRGGAELYDGDDYIGEQQMHGLDLIVNSIDLGMATLELEYCQLYASSEDQEGGQGTESPFSFFSGVFLDFKTFFGLPGNATVVAQYGQGYGSALQFKDAFDGTKNEDDPIKDAYKVRVLFTGVVEVTPELSIMPVLIYQYDDNGADSDGTATWVSAGLRAKQMLNKNFAIQLEYGFDYTAQDTGRATDADGDELKGMVHKVTIAPTLQLAPGFWNRPELRFYVTYAKWSSDFGDYRNSDGETRYIGFNQDDTSQVTLGLQAEAWW
jgi:maltoporin